MGNFYENVTLKGPSQSEIAGYLATDAYLAFVSPTVDGYTTIASEIHYMKNSEYLAGFAQDLSRHFQCPALAVLDHDDDVLAYVLYVSGARDHAYNSDPWYFDGEQLGGDFDLSPEEMPPKPGPSMTATVYTGGGDARALARLIGNNANVSEVDRILHTPDDFDEDEDEDENEYDYKNDLSFANIRHYSLLGALGLPQEYMGFDIRSLTGDKEHTFYGMTQILKVGGRT